MTTLVFIDIETASLDPHPRYIWEVGMVKTTDLGNELDRIGDAEHMASVWFQLNCVDPGEDR